jgi:hypothetical protein
MCSASSLAVLSIQISIVKIMLRTQSIKEVFIYFYHFPLSFFALFFMQLLMVVHLSIISANTIHVWGTRTKATMY